MKECPRCYRCLEDDIKFCPSDGSPVEHTLRGDTLLDGRYTLRRRLGQGGMGVVYKARHKFLKTTHAIKIILPDLIAGSDPEFITRFRQEAMAAANIRHHNVIAVTDFGVVGGVMPFLVMEFIQGKSLHELLLKERKLSPSRALEIMEPIAAGVGAAHRRDIVHRDLKPLNIMIEDDLPVQEGVKVLDFGLAKIKSGELLGSFVAAKTTGLMGSPFYMAPEQWSEEEPEKSADIYSLGIILYQMLAGDVPFKGPSIPTIMKKHLMDKPPPFSALGAAVPPQVEEVVRRALEKEPAKRPQTVQDFIEEVRGAVFATICTWTPPPEGAETDLMATLTQPAEEPLAGTVSSDLAGTVSSDVDIAVPPRQPAPDALAEEERLRREQEARLRLEAEARQRREEEARRAEEEARRQAEAERQRLEAEERRQREAEELRRRAEEQARKQAEEEARKKAAEEARRLAEEGERKRQEEERLRLEAEERARLEAEAKRLREEEEARKRAEEETRRRAEEEAARRAEEERLRREEEERLRQEAIAQHKREEEEAARWQAEVEARRLAAAEEARRIQEEEEGRQRLEAEAARLREEEERRRQEAEARRRAEEEEERQRAEEEAARGREEEAARARVEEESLLTESPFALHSPDTEELTAPADAAGPQPPDAGVADAAPPPASAFTGGETMLSADGLGMTTQVSQQTSPPFFPDSAPGVDTAEPSKASRSTLIGIGAAAAVLLLVGVVVVFYFSKGTTQREPPTLVKPAGQPATPPGAANPAGAAAPKATQPDMVPITGGTFRMGRDDAPPESGEYPAHAVKVESFFIDKTEVTNAEYAEFLRATKHPVPTDTPAPYWTPWAGNNPPAGQEQWPVRNVSPKDAEAFAAWRSQRDGVKYRLPREEEWEYAARNGSRATFYPWGNEWVKGYANFDEAALPQPVGSFPQGATSMGVLDMIGNVWEWTSSEPKLYPGNVGLDLAVPRGWRVRRGGSYRSKASGKETITATSRDWLEATKKTPVTGFRLVRDAP